MSPRSHHFHSNEARDFCITFATRKGSRSISIKPSVFYLAVGIIPVLGLWYLFATAYLIFRDDMLASLMQRQTEMQYAYEDRVTALHGQIDQLTSRRLLDEAALHAKMDELASRQARIETRSAIVKSLAERALPRVDAKAQAALTLNAPAASESHARQHISTTSPATPNPLLMGAFSNRLPQGVSAFAPVETNSSPAALAPAPNAKPRPDGFDLRQSEDLEPAPAHDKSSDLRDQGDGREALSEMTGALDRVERDQNRVLATLQTPLIGEMAKVRTALTEAGLSPDRLASQRAAANHKSETNPESGLSLDAIGGPFIPLKLVSDGSAFEREALSLQGAILAVEQMRRAVSSVPLRKPLTGDPDITSGFGARVDPFFGRAAMHTGIDLRDDYGTDVHATAAGKVTIAGPDGGYGNLVELDHGNGFSTRYAHMASIAVTEGQTVQAGQVVGHIGMTGRTTGPHLHYETRIDGEPVDPLRFLKLGDRLFAASPSIVSRN